MDSQDEKVTLPQVNHELIPLRVAVENIVEKSYHSLTNLTEILPNSSDKQKKISLYEMLSETRALFVKLYVLSKWCARAKEIHLCQNIIGFLQEQDEMFVQAALMLRDVYGELDGFKLRNYDLPTAIDVFNSQTYPNLPLAIKNIIPSSNRDDKTEETLLQLNHILRIRLAAQEVVPAPMTGYEIAKGCVKFIVKNEFEVTLTLTGPSTFDLWRILDVQILVSPADEVWGKDASSSFKVTGFQVHNLVNMLQFKLSPPPQESIGKDSNESRSPQYPLIFLYDFLHGFCLSLQLELIHSQASYLSRTRWNKTIKAEYLANRKCVRIYYWRSTKIQKSEILDGYRGCIEFRVTSTSLEDPTVYPKSWISISWAKELLDAPSSENSKESSFNEIFTYGKIGDNGNNIQNAFVNVEYLLNTVFGKHNDYIISSIDALLKSKPEFGEAYLTEIAWVPLKSHHALTNHHIGKDIMISSLAILLQYNCELKINVEIRSGQLLVTENDAGRTSSVKKKRISTVQKMINDNMASIHNVLQWLECETIINAIAANAWHFKLKVIEDIAPFTKDLEELLRNTNEESMSLEHILMLQFVEFPEFILVVTTKGGISTKTKLENGLSSFVNIYLMRLQSNLDTIQQIFPISGTNLYPNLLTKENPNVAMDIGSSGLALLSSVTNICKIPIYGAKLEEQLRSLNVQYERFPKNSSFHVFALPDFLDDLIFTSFEFGNDLNKCQVIISLKGDDHIHFMVELSKSMNKLIAEHFKPFSTITHQGGELSYDDTKNCLCIEFSDLNQALTLFKDTMDSIQELSLLIFSELEEKGNGKKEFIIKEYCLTEISYFHYLGYLFRISYHNQRFIVHLERQDKKDCLTTILGTPIFFANVKLILIAEFAEYELNRSKNLREMASKFSSLLHCLSELSQAAQPHLQQIIGFTVVPRSLDTLSIFISNREELLVTLQKDRYVCLEEVTTPAQTLHNTDAFEWLDFEQESNLHRKYYSGKTLAPKLDWKESLLIIMNNGNSAMQMKQQVAYCDATSVTLQCHLLNKALSQYFALRESITAMEK